MSWENTPVKKRNAFGFVRLQSSPSENADVARATAGSFADGPGAGLGVTVQL